ncbi:hypothetical protein LPB72_09780 [Hydrogenophaga crassostreae]|uniref:Uncharacterized protein n=1 Tax=Hydrogenophaga crassostreae TaxID=1763535 RepID=A0ABX2U749_9BURK|nr:hypothetical protein [Hydrogenophaga crassostreae]OAD41612.1 hypothetical protein LPB72_09780 [Hydrogenophaga crassostreae]
MKTLKTLGSTLLIVCFLVTLTACDNSATRTMAKNLATDTATIERNWRLLIQFQTGFRWKHRNFNGSSPPKDRFLQKS